MAKNIENVLWGRIAARLRRVRRSAQGASLRAGLDKDFARNIKRNKSLSPGHDKLRQFAERGLDCTLEELLGQNAGARDMKNPDENRLVTIYSDIPDDLRLDFLRLIEMLAPMLIRGSNPPRRRAGGTKRGQR